VNSLESTLTIESNKSISVLLKPSGLRGIAGTGAVIVTSENCGTIETDLGVNIHFTEVLVEEIDRVINEVFDFIISVFQ
jgi:hypothetical protein